jgi:hypothetical protein
VRGGIRAVDPVRLVDRAIAQRGLPHDPLRTGLTGTNAGDLQVFLLA